LQTPPKRFLLSIPEVSVACRRKKKVGKPSDAQRRKMFCYWKESRGKERLDGIDGRLLHIATTGNPKPKATIPVLLALPGNAPDPAVLYDLFQQARADHRGGMPESPQKSQRPTGMHGQAVRAMEPLHPQACAESLKIPLRKSMPP